MIQAGQSVYFIGICGTAMASCAVALKDRGLKVRGSDANVYPPMSTFLEANGIKPLEGFDPSHLHDKPDWIIVGNAISRGNPELEHVLRKRWAYHALPEILKEGFIRGRRSIVVSGTHGKTTVTSMLAWIFECAGRDPSFLIGGLPGNFERGARFTDSPWIILEGDEYDTAFFDKRSKFVHYLPEVLVINHLEFDHADIFRDLRAVQDTFTHLIRIIPSDGLILANGDAEHLRPLLDIDFCPVQRFGLDDDNDLRIRDLKSTSQGQSFSVGPETFELPMHGVFNALNALAAIACARHCEIPDHVTARALRSFRGVKRRMEIRGTPGGITVIDDFAHHPTAIEGTLKALRAQLPDRARLWVLFEPRSNTTRRNVFQHALTSALGHADLILLAGIAREHLLRPEERLNLPLLIDTLRQNGRVADVIQDPSSMVQTVVDGAAAGDIVAILSNGGFGGIHTQLLEALALRHAPT